MYMVARERSTSRRGHRMESDCRSLATRRCHSRGRCARHQRMTQFLFLLAGIISALVVAFVYITLAANAEANHQDRVMSVPLIGPELDAFLRALHGAAGECVVEGNEVEVFQNGDEIFAPMLAAIRESRSTIHFATYVYWAGAVPREFAKALSDAAQRGVMVRLVLDSEGTDLMPRELKNQMRDAGCNVTWFR